MDQNSVIKTYEHWLWEIIRYAGPILALILVLVFSYFLAKTVKHYLHNFLLSMMGADRAKQAHRWSIFAFWIIILGALVFVLGYAYSASFSLISKSEVTQRLSAYFGKFFSAGLIFLFGIILSHYLRLLATSALEKLDYSHAEMIGRIVGVVSVVLFGIVAFEQLNFNVDLIRNLVLIVVFLIGLSFTISLGLGTKQFSANIVAGNFARTILQPGAQIKVDEIDGIVVNVGTISTVIEVSHGERVLIPNEKLVYSVVRLTKAKS